MLNLLKNGEVIRQVYPGSRLDIPEEQITVTPAEAGWSYDEYELVEAPEPEPVPVNLDAYNAQKRWEKEISGITVSGAQIDTSRESQSMIAGAYAYSQANPDEVIQFKSASGWVTLDAATMAAIATAVGSYVQACFALEASVAAAITDGTITTTTEIDAAFG